MKEYPEIKGPSGAPNSACIAFYKYDGMNFRAEWSRKRGWYKFGTRTRMIDSENSQWGGVIPLFLETYGDSLPPIFKSEKDFRGVDSFTVFCEMWSENSFAGTFPVDGTMQICYPKDEPAKITLIEVNANRKGFVLPRQFVNIFQEVGIPPVVYEGNFNDLLIEDVKNNNLGIHLVEGIVAKGVIPQMKNDQHGFWMVKVKTKEWMERIRTAGDLYKRQWDDNSEEQL